MYIYIVEGGGGDLKSWLPQAERKGVNNYGVEFKFVHEFFFLDRFNLQGKKKLKKLKKIKNGYLILGFISLRRVG